MRPEDREALVRRSMDAWNADDWEKELEAIWSPDGTVVAPDGWPEAGEFKGWRAMVEQWRRIKGSWAEERVDLVESEPLGDRVLAQVHWVMQGEASGAPLEVDVSIVCEFEDERLSRMEYFLDREAALTAAEAPKR
jgi:ketosteroid isomerase-like protein